MSENTKPKQPAHRWPPGTSGNPAGRPRGSRHAALLALDSIGSAGAEDALRAVVRAAQDGDVRAADILLRRLWPERRGRPVDGLDLPAMASAADLAAGVGAVAAAVVAGVVSPEEGQAIAAVMEAHRRALETADLEQRIVALETREAAR